MPKLVRKGKTNSLNDCTVKEFVTIVVELVFYAQSLKMISGNTLWRLIFFFLSTESYSANRIVTEHLYLKEAFLIRVVLKQIRSTMKPILPNSPSQISI